MSVILILIIIGLMITVVALVNHNSNMRKEIVSLVSDKNLIEKKQDDLSTEVKSELEDYDYNYSDPTHFTSSYLISKEIIINGNASSEYCSKLIKELELQTDGSGWKKDLVFVLAKEVEHKFGIRITRTERLIL